MTERPLRILQVTAASAGGDWFLDQVRGLAARGHTVCAVMPAEGPLSSRLRAVGIRTEIIAFRGGASTNCLGWLRRGAIGTVDPASSPTFCMPTCSRPCCAAARPLLVFGPRCESPTPGTVHLNSPMLRWPTWVLCVWTI